MANSLNTTACNSHSKGRDNKCTRKVFVLIINLLKLLIIINKLAKLNQITIFNNKMLHLPFSNHSTVGYTDI